MLGAVVVVSAFADGVGGRGEIKDGQAVAAFVAQTYSTRRQAIDASLETRRRYSTSAESGSTRDDGLALAAAEDSAK